MNYEKPLVIYGRHTVEELLNREPKKIKKIFIKDSAQQSLIQTIRERARQQKVILTLVPEKKINELVGDAVNHQGIVAECTPFEYQSYEQWKQLAPKSNQEMILIIDHIQDVGNLGAIIRSATALGVSAIFVPDRNQAPITSAVYKTSAGTLGVIPIIQIGNINQLIERLKQDRFWIVGLDTQGEQSVYEYDFTDSIALVIGSEGEGIRAQTLKHCDSRIFIPMTHNVESLNASVSVAVVCAEALRQKSVK
jgi:23S rRNA (guanosine2251-2'-O)-methyltransferase